MKRKLYNKARDIIYRCSDSLSTIVAKMVFWINDVDYGDHLKVCGRIFMQKNGRMVIGKNVRINSSFRSNPISPSNRTGIIIRGGVFTIDDDSGISNAYFVCQNEIRIGKQVMIGAGCQFYDTDFHPLNSQCRSGEYRDDSKTRTKPIVVEDKVFIGAGAIILKGTLIGEGAIIGAGSVVSGKIPPYEIWAGNPAKYIRKGE